ncbi:MAG: flagellar type III secretion system pore protein FliP [Vallitaleaceae bacterium]|jgi:flagellar biosynthetic protein FliP|nr:flagellar type III secretion system pore protein FliP [Vallitaleaceae bacterium]
MGHRGKRKVVILIVSFFCVLQLFMLFGQQTIYAETTDTPIPISFDLSVSNSEDSADVVSSIQILVILTIISLAPSILIMTTSFTRIIVVLHFTRSALGTQQTPPNQVLVGLALFLTLFIMTPIYSQINEEALQPYSNGELTQQEAIDTGLAPLREFMFSQVNDKDLRLFVDIARVEIVGEGDELRESIPTTVLIPAFIVSELRIAFIIGFLIYIPFIAVDMIVASTLMSMGMMMLPPVMISMPFKLLLFVLADGWSLIISELVKTFYHA